MVVFIYFWQGGRLAARSMNLMITFVERMGVADLEAVNKSIFRFRFQIK